MGGIGEREGALNGQLRGGHGFVLVGPIEFICGFATFGRGLEFCGEDFVMRMEMPVQSVNWPQYTMVVNSRSGSYDSGCPGSTIFTF